MPGKAVAVIVLLPDTDESMCMKFCRNEAVATGNVDCNTALIKRK